MTAALNRSSGFEDGIEGPRDDLAAFTTRDRAAAARLAAGKDKR